MIRYRSRSALREVAKVLGIAQDKTAALTRTVWGRSSRGLDPTQAAESGMDAATPEIARMLCLARELIGFPRHLSQHVGGFVITRGRLDELVPIENAAMAERTVIEWDKDDLDALNILKIDVLALGMLSCLRRAFGLLADHHGRRLDLATLPAEDDAVYEMLCRADSIGVFQVESRAQMSMLPRLRPRCFYDLVIEVSIVRPARSGRHGPSLPAPPVGQGAGALPSEALRDILGKPLGVPLFQEQAMRIAIVAAGFSAADADRLRRAMATFKNTAHVSELHDKMIDGMLARGYERDFAERCFHQIEGFGTYGFPESHAASFALLVYASAWIKCHYPDVFAAALLNSQPMGFYAPAQIVRDARDHGVEVRAVDINASHWDCTLEESAVGLHKALRLGFGQVRGLGAADGARIVAARDRDGPFFDAADLATRSGLGKGALARLARADAFAGIALPRRPALWVVAGLEAAPPLPLFAAAGNGGPRLEAADDTPALPTQGPGEAVAEDYRSLRLSLRDHPLRLLRPQLREDGFVPCRELDDAPAGTRIRLAGLVLVRQRPGTASGIVFMMLEDEDGIANIVVWPKLFERQRPTVMAARLLGVSGRIEREGEAPYRVTHVIAERVFDLTPRLDGLDEAASAMPVVSRDFH